MNPSVRLSDLDYPLPEDLIAEKPSPERDHSRMMVLSRADRTIRDEIFTSIAGLIRPGDCMIFNNTRVIKARLFGKRDSGGKTEALLVERTGPNTWKALLRSPRKSPVGSYLYFHDVRAKMAGRTSDGDFILEFDDELTPEIVDRIGVMPIPPYIVHRRKELHMPAQLPEDDAWYQSLFAREPGSVAAPTASLHFSPPVIDNIKSKGVDFGYVTLHVGPGTFKPIDTEIGEFRIHREWVEVPKKTIELIRKTRADGGRVIAVGTTVARSLETMAINGWEPFEGYTELMISPPYGFQALDALVTNFHMPRSTLLLLVYAFAGMNFVREAYSRAVEKRYRFYSYGDAMFII
ncbi:MAG: tRNA preQ1(34) S-adenosylmethionine ribosyltransferase-isomerase QueA [Spirochaetes bacterium GWF1_51_8]|nr:MAG: tRNA preQ1(34) S-adenosylmethionine ribosyltransferase-isomerase QueA [Spirochaetes bacterium GWF1_51_8]